MSKKVDPPSEFGKRLAALRLAKGLTQTQLAEAISSTQRTVSYYETTAEYPTVQALLAIAKVLHVSLDELVGLKPSKERPQAQPKEERRLWKQFRLIAQLPERDQRAVLRFISTAAAHAGITRKAS